MPRLLTAILTCALVAVGLLTPSCASALAAPSASDWDPTRVTVMSFNVLFGVDKDPKRNGWPARRRVAVEILRRRAPDVIGLQEPRAFQVDQIKEQLRQYGEVGFGARPAVERAQRCAILYRRDRFRVAEEGWFWFSDTPEKPYSKSWGNTMPRVCNWARLVDRHGTGSFYIYNVHLEPGKPRTQQRSVEMLARRIAARRHRSDPVVITGDFNAGDSDIVIRFLTGRADRASHVGPPPPRTRFLDTWRVKYPNDGTAGTFHGFRGGRTASRIDYVFVSPDLVTVDAQIIRDHGSGQFPSDHYPVIATIEWPPAGAIAPAAPPPTAPASRSPAS